MNEYLEGMFAGAAVVGGVWLLKGLIQCCREDKAAKIRKELFDNSQVLEGKIIARNYAPETPEKYAQCELVVETKEGTKRAFVYDGELAEKVAALYTQEGQEVKFRSGFSPGDEFNFSRI